MDREITIPTIDIDDSIDTTDDDKSEWSRFDRLMQSRLRHDLLDRKEELRLIAAAKREIDTWNARTAKFERAADTTRDFKKWLRARTRRAEDGALDQLLGKNYKIILKTAFAYRTWAKRLNYEISEIFDIAVFGFLRAIGKFNAKKGVRLSTYSVLWMRAEIGRELHGRGRMIHVPYNVDIAASGAGIAIGRFRTLHGRDPDDVELADQLIADFRAKKAQEKAAKRRGRNTGKLRFTTEKRSTRKSMSKRTARSIVEQYHSTPPAPVSADIAISHENDSTLLDLFTYDGAITAGTALIRSETATRVREALKLLPEAERLVLEYRFLRCEQRGGKDMTLNQVARVLPKRVSTTGKTLSRERIRQLQNQGLARLRKKLAEYAPRAA